MKLITTSLLAFFTLQSQPPLKMPEIRHQDWTPPVQIRSGFSNRQHSHDLLISQVNPNDYAMVEVDGQSFIIHKSELPDYRPQFSLEMVHLQPAASAAHDFFSNSYADDPKYFANHFKDCYPEQIFHCLANYRFSGFRQYVQDLPGFNDFIESIGPELQAGSVLHKTLATDLNHLKCFEILQNIHNQQCYDQAKVAREFLRCAQADYLRQQQLSLDGIRLLEHYGVVDEFLYHQLPCQEQQFTQILQHLNETGEFWQTHQHDHELVAISDQAASFGIMANRALKNNETVLSQTLLDVGQNFLALGKGIIKSAARNLGSTLEMLHHPFETGTQIVHLVKKIGVGIGKAAYLMAQFQTAFDLGDQQLLDQASAQLDHYLNRGRQLYLGVKQMLQEATPVERYEMLGSLVTDGVFLVYGGKINGILGRLAPIRKLNSYKGQALDQLGQIGRDIHQIAGLTYAKGAKPVSCGFEVIQNSPWIIQGHQSIASAIQAGRHYLDSSNQYLAKLSRHTTKSILDPERRLMRWGNQVKKLPKTCIAKVKQFLGDEAVVVDVYGNKWTSKIDQEDWLVQLSEKGRQSLVLLNEAVAGGAETIAVSKKITHRTIELSKQAKQIIKEKGYKIKALIRNQYSNMMFEEFYGPKVCEFLQGRAAWMKHQINEFKGLDHLFMPSIKQNIGKGKLTEKIVGFHLDNGRQLEQAGMYVLKNCKELIGGMYEADLHIGGIFKAGKTFFPSNWDEAKLLSKIREACHNAHKISFMPRSKGVVEIRGMVEEGFEIVIRLNKRGKKLTAYPNPVKIL